MAVVTFWGRIWRPNIVVGRCDGREWAICKRVLTFSSRQSVSAFDLMMRQWTQIYATSCSNWLICSARPYASKISDFDTFTALLFQHHRIIHSNEQHEITLTSSEGRGLYSWGRCMNYQLGSNVSGADQSQSQATPLPVENIEWVVVLTRHDLSVLMTWQGLWRHLQCVLWKISLSSCDRWVVALYVCTSSGAKRPGVVLRLK